MGRHNAERFRHRLRLLLACPVATCLAACAAWSDVRGVATGNLGVGKDGQPTDNFQLGMELLGKYTVFAEGEPGDRLYIIITGKVKIGRRSPDGRENLLAVLGPGETLGELSLFDPGPRSATVTAVTDASFASLSHDDLLKWLDGRPMVARGLLSQITYRPTPRSAPLMARG